jgi:hypothetical protein
MQSVKQETSERFEMMTLGLPKASSASLLA